MAGDWIKMRVDLSTSPKVVRIASALRADRLRVIGGLHAVWSLFDAHSSDGVLDGYTLEAMDELIGFPGFSASMASVGWLVDDGEALQAPRFDEHNGQSAKRRAMETERKRTERNASASDADKKRSREEKSREEKKEQDPPAARAPRATKKCPESFSLNAGLIEFAATEAPGVSVEREFDKFRDHTFKVAHSDWAGAFRNWIRNAADRAKPAGNSFLAEKQAEGAKWIRGTSLDRNHIDTENDFGTQLAIR